MWAYVSRDRQYHRGFSAKTFALATETGVTSFMFDSLDDVATHLHMFISLDVGEYREIGGGAEDTEVSVWTGGRGGRGGRGGGRRERRQGQRQWCTNSAAVSYTPNHTPCELNTFLKIVDVQKFCQ